MDLCVWIPGEEGMWIPDWGGGGAGRVGPQIEVRVCMPDQVYGAECVDPRTWVCGFRTKCMALNVWTRVTSGLGCVGPRLVVWKRVCGSCWVYCVGRSSQIRCREMGVCVPH